MATMNSDKRLAAWNNAGFAFLVALAFTPDREIFAADRLPAWAYLLKFVVFFGFTYALQRGWDELSNTRKKRASRLLTGVVLVVLAWTVTFIFSYFR
ncbi:MAG: hypothetical protein Q4A31_07260 [Corynebacterium sp.]|uniref:hypothetical protein n=1 Tax=Corynebacterium sp. TaxID=1720 RepID=UPI0026DB7259|nr:hypothetical protein [Corynebacterium sp.]MDO4761699.1 hypothetical protein [Corynebacterium sp.]